MELPLILSVLVFSLLFSGICFLIGFGFGWFGREYYENAIAVKKSVGHPEMFDENGNLLPDELIAVRFENFEEEEDDEEEDD